MFRANRETDLTMMRSTLPFLAVGYQPIQLVPLFHLGSRDAFIGINVDELIFGMLLGIVAVVADLCGEGMELVGGIA